MTAYEEGMNAWWPDTPCPYDEGTEAWDAWWDGYLTIEYRASYEFNEEE